MEGIHILGLHKDKFPCPCCPVFAGSDGRAALSTCLEFYFLSVLTREHTVRKALHAAFCPATPGESDASGGLFKDETPVGESLHDISNVPAVIYPTVGSSYVLQAHAFVHV